MNGLTEKEVYLKHVRENKLNVYSEEVETKCKELGIVLGEHPYKLYGVTYDGNRNEVCFFLDAFATYEEAANEPLTDSQFHDRMVDVEEDY